MSNGPQQLPTAQQYWELLHLCLAVVSKQMQQLPTVLDLQCIVGRIQPIRLCKLQGDHV